MCVRKELLLIANQEKCEYLSKSFTKINGFLPEEIVNYYNTDTSNSNNSNNLNNILDFKDNSIYQKKISALPHTLPKSNNSSDKTLKDLKDLNDLNTFNTRLKERKKTISKKKLDYNMDKIKNIYLDEGFNEEGKEIIGASNEKRENDNSSEGNKENNKIVNREGVEEKVRAKAIKLVSNNQKTQKPIKIINKSSKTKNDSQIGTGNEEQDRLFKESLSILFSISGKKNSKHIEELEFQNNTRNFKNATDLNKVLEENIKKEKLIISSNKINEITKNKFNTTKVEDSDLLKSELVELTQLNVNKRVTYDEVYKINKTKNKTNYKTSFLKKSSYLNNNICEQSTQTSSSFNALKKSYYNCDDIAYNIKQNSSSYDNEKHFPKRKAKENMFSDLEFFEDTNSNYRNKFNTDICFDNFDNSEEDKIIIPKEKDKNANSTNNNTNKIISNLDNNKKYKNNIINIMEELSFKGIKQEDSFYKKKKLIKSTPIKYMEDDEIIITSSSNSKKSKYLSSFYSQKKTSSDLESNEAKLNRSRSVRTSSIVFDIEKHEYKNIKSKFGSNINNSISNSSNNNIGLFKRNFSKEKDNSEPLQNYIKQNLNEHTNKTNLNNRSSNESNKIQASMISIISENSCKFSICCGDECNESEITVNSFEFDVNKGGDYI